MRQERQTRTPREGRVVVVVVMVCLGGEGGTLMHIKRRCTQWPTASFFFFFLLARRKRTCRLCALQSACVSADVNGRGGGGVEDAASLHTRVWRRARRPFFLFHTLYSPFSLPRQRAVGGGGGVQAANYGAPSKQTHTHTYAQEGEQTMGSDDTKQKENGSGSTTLRGKDKERGKGVE